MSAKGRPEREHRSAQHEGAPVSITAAPTAAALAVAHAERGAARLSDDEIRRFLAVLPGWTRVEDRLEKTFRFADYPRTMAFVNAVAFIAQREDHHPDLSVHYDRCVVALSTHDAGGITGNDCVFAARVERLWA